MVTPFGATFTFASFDGSIAGALQAVDMILDLPIFGQPVMTVIGTRCVASNLLSTVRFLVSLSPLSSCRCRPAIS